MTKNKQKACQGGEPSSKSWNESLKTVNCSIRKEHALQIKVTSSPFTGQSSRSVLGSGEAATVGGVATGCPDVIGGVIPAGGSLGNDIVYNDVEPSAGLISMCNGKTKNDCYMYRVFGLPIGKLEDVKKIQPGMKLFLYDFDLKLLYGIYEATSHGQLNLEPMAFDERFPSQVKFRIFKDCLPVHETVFRHAINKNYRGFKFKQELQSKQVNSLMELFRPIDLTPPLSNSLQPFKRLPPADGTCVSEAYHTGPLNMPRHHRLGHANGHFLYEPYLPETQVLGVKSAAEPQYQIQEVAHVHPKQNLQGSHPPYVPEEPRFAVTATCGSRSCTGDGSRSVGSRVCEFAPRIRPAKRDANQSISKFCGWLLYSTGTPASAATHSNGIVPSYIQPLACHPYGGSSSSSHQPYYPTTAHAIQSHGSVPPLTNCLGSANSSNQSSALSSSQYAFRGAAATFP